VNGVLTIQQYGGRTLETVGVPPGTFLIIGIDPDMLEVGNGGMTVEEYRCHFSLWALMKAPLLIGCDVRNISADILEILSNGEVVAVNQDPLGVQGKRVRQQGLTGLEVWSGPLSSGRVALLLWNRSSKDASITATYSDIGIEHGTSVAIRDVWKHETIKKAVKLQQITQTVPSHGVKMFVITPTKLCDSTESEQQGNTPRTANL
jgi:alpha-galactosidase